MAKASLRYAIEQYAIELCMTHRMLKARIMRHSDDASDAEKDCLVFRATVGERDLSGVAHFHVQLEIESRSTGKPEDNDAVVGAIYEAILGATRGSTSAEKLFLVGTGFLIREDGLGSERRDTSNLRVSVVTIPFRARLADDASSTAERG